MTHDRVPGTTEPPEHRRFPMQTCIPLYRRCSSSAAVETCVQCKGLNTAVHLHNFLHRQAGARPSVLSRRRRASYRKNGYGVKSTEAWSSLLVLYARYYILVQQWGRGGKRKDRGEFFIYKEERTCFCSVPAYGEAASLSNEASRDPDSATPSRLYIACPPCSLVLLPDEMPPDWVQSAKCALR